MIKVLVPFDFSETAAHALHFAAKLSDNYSQIQITVLHVLEMPISTGMSTMGGGMDPIPDFQNQVFFIDMLEARKKDLLDLETKYRNSAFTLRTKLVAGNVFRSISEAIEKEHPDLVVIGSKGSSGFEEILIGSNTEKVVRTASCPVITVKAETEVVKMKKIVFASDFKESNDAVATRFKRIQNLFDAEFFFVIVNTPGSFETTRESLSRIRTYVQKHHFKNVKAEVYNALSEEQGIIDFADDIDADLIAMTTHGRTGLLHLLTGSIAEDVVNHSKRPVWTYKTN